jgi:multisubunit Na+/H+ antiporter MnhE subunit
MADGKDTPRRAGDQLAAGKLRPPATLSNIPASNPWIAATRMQLRDISRRVVFITLLLSAAWYILSGRFDLLPLGSGVVVAAAIALNFPAWQDRSRFRPVRFLLYGPWLAVQVVKSNLRVARAVLSPRMDIAPTFISRRPDVVGDLALTTLGASTTLTPGTLTVDVSQHEIFIHALDRHSIQDVEEGMIAKQVAGVFEERP